MKAVTRSIEEQIGLLAQWGEKARKAIQESPEGIFAIRTRGSQTEWAQKQDGKWRYLPKSEERTARRMAQASYARDFLRSVEKMRDDLERLKVQHASRSAIFLFHALSAPHERLSAARKALVEPFVLPDKEFIISWQEMSYEGKPFSLEAPEIYSERGERVRSKSEKMIADMLNHMGLPYRYECPVVIRGVGTFYPDFTILDISERTQVYYEHFGLMDDPEYAKNAFRKIEQFEKHGLSLGTNFFCSFESAGHVINLKHIEKVMRERFF